MDDWPSHRILINPDSEDLVLNQENFAIWASGRDVYPFYEVTFIDIYKSVIKNLDKAMPLEEAEQYYPQWSHEDQEWQMVKK